MIESAIGGIAVPVFEQVWKAGGFAVSEAKKAYDQTQAVQKAIAASNRYVQKYEDRHGQIKIMPGLMKEPLPLESIYTAVKLLDDQSRRFFVSQDTLEEAYRESGRRGFRLGGDERLDGMDIANQKQYLMVLGSPGVGKSTFLRKLGLEALKREGLIQRECVPVFIELKELKGETLDLKQAIAKEFETCGFPAALEFTGSMLAQGKLLVLLDGLDEVPTRNFNPVIEHIEDFVDQYDKNAFVASCRIAAYTTSFHRFTDVTIAEFDDDQIEQFIQRWFNSEFDQQAKTAQTYWELLQQDNNKAAKELAQTPLLLTFLCLVYDREQTLPNARSSLYGDALNILLKEWSAQKRLERDPIYEGFHPGLEKLLLAEIAHDSFKQDQLFFSKDDIISRITEFLTDTLDAPTGLDGEEVLAAIEKQQGILVERATDTYSFSHLTLQEYLTALHIVDRQLINEVAADHLTENRWREVFLLLAGLMGGRVDQLWRIIDLQAQTYIAPHPKACDLLKWADAVIDTTSETIKPIAKKATALAIAINIAITINSAIVIAKGIDGAIDSAGDSARTIAINSVGDSPIDSAKAIDNAIDSAIAIAKSLARAISIARARAIDIDSARTLVRAKASAIAIDIDIVRAKASINELINAQVFKLKNLSIDQLYAQLTQLQQSIPGEDDSSEQWLQWADQLESAWPNALNLTKEDLTFSKAEAEALQDYLCTNELLICCKQSAVRVSRKAWEDLEARLLTLG